MVSSPTVILVTGGSGFLGQHLVQELLCKYPEVKVRTISRGGSALQELSVKCPDPRLMPVIGDIRDPKTVQYILKGVGTVIHLAAMKYIDVCETQPIEGITTNIDGTRNLLNAFKGNTFIGMSTDKAVEATSCYGATKLVMEKLILEQAKRWEDRRYMVVRSGNIFGSTGSVIEKWKRQIKQRNEISITDPAMTRFFINARDLVDFIIEIVENGQNGSINIPCHQSLTLSDMAKAVIDLWGNKKTVLNITGPRLGEKLHESLFSVGEKVSYNVAVRKSCDSSPYPVDKIKEWLTDLERD